MGRRAVEGLQRREVVHVADVRRQPGVPTVADAERVLQVAADRQRRVHRPPAARPAAARSRASGAPAAGAGRRGARPSRRTGTWIGRSWASQASASGEPDAGRGVVGDDRLAGEVAAGHHQHPRAGRVARQPEQQVVHRCVGEHHADVGVAGGDRGRQRCVGPPRQQDHRAPRIGRAGRARPAAACASAARVVEVGDHHRERLVAAVLALAQRGDRGLVGRVAGQVVAAEALDRDDRALGEQAPRRDHRVETDQVVAAAAGQPQRRPAVVTGHRLGVEAAVGRVGVLGRAPLAQRQLGHRRVRPVVGQRDHDREARAAVRAADERVPVAAVGRVGQLGQAVVAGGDIGRDEGAPRLGGRAGGDGEFGAAAHGQLPALHRLDERQRRRVGANPLGEGRQGVGRTLDLDLDAGGGVPHRAGQAELTGQGVDERAETDALDDAGDAQPVPRRGGCGTGGWAIEAPARLRMARPPVRALLWTPRADAKPDGRSALHPNPMFLRRLTAVPSRRSLALSTSGGPAMGRFHRHDGDHDHSHTHARSPDHGHEPVRDLGDHTGYATGTERIDVLERIFDENDRTAAANRADLERAGVFAINLMSSPGAGKTALLRETLARLGARMRVGVDRGRHRDEPGRRPAGRLRRRRSSWSTPATASAASAISTRRWSDRHSSGSRSSRSIW